MANQVTGTKTEKLMAWVWLVFGLVVGLSMAVNAVLKGSIGLALFGVGLVFLGITGYLEPLPMRNDIQNLVRRKMEFTPRIVVLNGIAVVLVIVGLLVHLVM